MVLDSTLRYHAFSVRHVCIISVRENARGREFRWEEGLWPWFGGVGSGPGLLAVACQAVDEDNTGSVSWQNYSREECTYSTTGSAGLWRSLIPQGKTFVGCGAGADGCDASCSTATLADALDDALDAALAAAAFCRCPKSRRIPLRN